MAGVTTFGHGYMSRWLPGRTDSTCLRVTAVAFIRTAGEYAIDMTPFTFNQSMRTFQAKTGREMIEGWRRLRTHGIKRQQREQNAGRGEDDRQNQSCGNSHYLSPIREKDSVV